MHVYVCICPVYPAVDKFYSNSTIKLYFFNRKKKQILNTKEIEPKNITAKFIWLSISVTLEYLSNICEEFSYRQYLHNYISPVISQMYR